MEKERLEREEQNQLTEEQREEIKEAVCSPPPFFFVSQAPTQGWNESGGREWRGNGVLK